MMMNDKQSTATATTRTTQRKGRFDRLAKRRPQRPWPGDHFQQQEEEEDNHNWWRRRLEGAWLVYERWTFHYMNHVFDRKKNKLSSTSSESSSEKHNDNTLQNEIKDELTLDDLLAIPQSMQAKQLANDFRKYYKEAASSSSTSSSSQKQQQQQPSPPHLWPFIVALGRLAAPTFVPAGFCQLASVISQVTLPLLVRALLMLLEAATATASTAAAAADNNDNNNDNDDVMTQGLLYAAAIFVSLWIDALATHRHGHLALLSGVVLRATVVQVMYEHVVVHLSPAGRQGLRSGQVSNLIATDTQKLFEVTQDGHLAWSLPLSMISTTILLLVFTLGPSTLIGIVVLMAFVPVVERVTAAMMKIRKQRVQCTDARIGQINAMLQGIKTTKLNHYEDKYKQRVDAARNQELFWLQRELMVWGATVCITVSSPIVAAAATFCGHALIHGGDDVLTASQSFAVLLFFNILRFPINFAGRWIGKAAQAYSALQRIAEFLHREVREEKHAENATISSAPPTLSDLDTNANANNTLLDTTTQDQGPPLILRNAVFRIGKDMADPDLPQQQQEEEGTHSSLHSSPSGQGSRHGKVRQEKEKQQQQVEDPKPAFQVSEFNFSVNKGEVLAVCGPVGCGKTTLIHGIIHEVDASPETIVRTNGRVAFVPQTPFIINATLRDNILFGRPYQQELYERVLDVCCLGPDIEQLGRARDMTEIGERGVTLSGGQKQRVSLARAAYSEPDLVLLDDPLSALDAGTAKLVFERLIKSQTAFFSDTAVVLVTHASHFFNQVDQILVIVDGSNEFLGRWGELATFQVDRRKTQSAIDFIRSSVQEQEEAKNTQVSAPADQESNGNRDAGDGIEKGELMTIEEREHGLSSLNTWLLWFQKAGGVWFLFLQIIFLSIDRFSYVAVEYWLARWTDGADGPIDEFGVSFDAQTEGRAAQSKYITVYMILVVLSILTTVLRSLWIVMGGARAGRAVFESMLQSVLSAPLSYFETTPMGRVLNRFTYDMEVIDLTLTIAMSLFVISTGWFVAGMAVIVSILPWMGLAIVPVCTVYWLLLLHYRKSATDLQRLDALTRSPVQAMVGEGLDGSATIRVFQQEQTFVKSFRSHVDDNSSALLNFVSAQRWLGFRIQVLGSFVVLTSCVLVVVLNDTSGIDPGLVGLLVMWSSNFTITLGYWVEVFSETEASITAIERVNAMSSLPQERAMETDKEAKPPMSWPETGAVEFKDVCLRYRKGLPLALNHLSFKIPGGKRCGVVGRTGAGKSSLTVALFRLVEIESGSILLDGVDLATLGLADVRGRSNGMSIIPQDPFLAGRTIRECLDPFDLSRDEDILEALDAVRLSSVTLQTPVEEGGSNFSVGERQLLNLARQLLFKPRVLVLDESTASIDGETDAFIQAMLRTRFQETTLLTVAHRLNTIMDYDLILVMDAGQAVELGSPAELLDQNGVFAELVDATGPEGSKALRAMVIQNQQ